MVLEFQHRNSKEYLRGFTELIRVDQRPPEERGVFGNCKTHRGDS